MTFNFEIKEDKNKENEMIKAYGGTPVSLIINLTQHNMTAAQYNHKQEHLMEVKYIGYEQQVKNDILYCLNFDTLPTKEEIKRKAEVLATIAKNTFAQAKARTGMHKAKEYALIGGAPYLMGPLEEALKELDIQPLYAFSQRISVETTQPDGSVIKTNKFEHLGYVEA